MTEKPPPLPPDEIISRLADLDNRSDQGNTQAGGDATVAPWSIARQLEIPRDDQGHDFGPALSLDGRTLLFHGYRRGTHGQDDLWMVRRVPKP